MGGWTCTCQRYKSELPDNVSSWFLPLSAHCYCLYEASNSPAEETTRHHLDSWHPSLCLFCSFLPVTHHTLRVKHPNILQLVDVFETKKEYFLFLELWVRTSNESCWLVGWGRGGLKASCVSLLLLNSQCWFHPRGEWAAVAQGLVDIKAAPNATHLAFCYDCLLAAPFSLHRAFLRESCYIFMDMLRVKAWPSPSKWTPVLCLGIPVGMKINETQEKHVCASHKNHLLLKVRLSDLSLDVVIFNHQYNIGNDKWEIWFF